MQAKIKRHEQIIRDTKRQRSIVLGVIRDNRTGRELAEWQMVECRLACKIGGHRAAIVKLRQKEA